MSESRLLLVDDQVNVLESLHRGLALSGFRVITTESNPIRAAERIEQGERFDVALIDVNMPGMDGIALLERIKAVRPEIECIMISAHNEARWAVESLRRGAYDYLVKPFQREDLLKAISRAVEHQTLLEIACLPKRRHDPGVENEEYFAGIVSGSLSMRRIMREAELHARSTLPVLITGESGTGKELFARAIHRASRRSAGPFLAINMTTLTDNLFDSAFFGHTKGAFTGAERDHAGYLELCAGGTLFLDEIGHMPLNRQGTLLRVLQEQEFFKLGNAAPRKSDVRFIAATNADLDMIIAQGAFRRDLYFRLRGAWIDLPPLRERRSDIPLIVQYILTELRSEGAHGSITVEALSLLMNYDFPGNVRELRSMIQGAVNIAQGKPLAPAHFPSFLKSGREAPPPQLVHAQEEPQSLAELEKTYITKIYIKSGKNKAHAAKSLGIGINTLRRRLEEYGLT